MCIRTVLGINLLSRSRSGSRGSDSFYLPVPNNTPEEVEEADGDGGEKARRKLASRAKELDIKMVYAALVGAVEGERDAD